MKNLTLTVLFLVSSLSGFCGTTTIASSGFTFSPASVTIHAGDSVSFQLSNIHNAVEVSQTTWNANGTAALSGGFSVAYGGGTVMPANLPVGVHYYVCQAHASMGMKGIITVASANGIQTVTNTTLHVSVYPMPFNNQATVKITAGQNLQNGVFVMYDALGKEVSRINVPDQLEFNIQRNGLADGVYLYRILSNGQAISEGKLMIQQ